MRRFDFSTLSNGQSTSLILMQNIDISEWGTAALMVRVAAVDMSGGDVQIVAASDSLSSDDPRATFVTPVIESDGVPIAIAVSNTTAAPMFSCRNLLGSLGAGLRVIAQATRSSVSGNIAVTMSVELCLKNEIIEVL
jgi:hypothetical protein